jgi:hypothetical protein
MPQTFTNSEQVLQYLQKNYGSANYSSWQSLRKQFYSFVQYTAAGLNQYNFFGFAVTGAAGQNKQFTNMPKAGSFGQNHFLLKSIQCSYYLHAAVDTWTVASALDVNNAAADFLHGFAQAGVFQLTIGSKQYAQIPRPFLYCPPADGSVQNVDAKHIDFTLTEATPNTMNVVEMLVSHADLNRNASNRYLVDPSILIEAEQAFTAEIDYPSGVIPLISTGKLTTNFYIGVIFDGILFRPVQ